MCGISGVYLYPNSPNRPSTIVDAMVAKLSHRGPDSFGTFSCEEMGIALGHNRLSILDLSSAGNQPMSTSDGRFTIVFNGEIYNYLELRDSLLSEGVVFRSQTDTEVLLELYRRYGMKTPELLRGMFAFAIYDHETRELFLARDRIGKKPLLYAETSDGFFFASEIPALAEIQHVDTRVNRSALASLFYRNLRHIPDPYTVYRGIRRLRPGHAAIVRRGEPLRSWRYWSFPLTKISASPEQLLNSIIEAVRLRLRSDVPIGALLSGGVDSTAIVALMKDGASPPIKTYALGYNSEDEDLRRARVAATALGVEHKEFYFDSEKQLSNFQTLLSIFGEPIMLLPLTFSYELCCAIRDDGIRVVMSGIGADEVFCGYTGQRATARYSSLVTLFSPLLACLSQYLPLEFRALTQPAGQRKAVLYDSLYSSDIFPLLSEECRHEIIAVAAEEMRYWGSAFPFSDYLDESNFIGLMIENAHSVAVSTDLPAMAASIEMRAPFLDQEIVALGFQLARSKKVGPWPYLQSKVILKEAVMNLVPHELIGAPKRGFGFGIQEERLFRTVWGPIANSIFERPSSIDGFLDSRKVTKCWSDFRDKKAAVKPALIAKLFALQTWDRLRRINNENTQACSRLHESITSHG